MGTFAGTGATNIKILQVWSGLKNPFSLGSVQTDANGDGSVSFVIPNKQQWIGKKVWAQAVELNNSSSVIADTLR